MCASHSLRCWIDVRHLLSVARCREAVQAAGTIHAVHDAQAAAKLGEVMPPNSHDQLLACTQAVVAADYHLACIPLLVWSNAYRKHLWG